MYKDKEKQKEATKDRVRRYRDKQKGVTKEGVTGLGVTSNVRPTTDNYPAVLYALTDPIKRKKLEKIYHSLKEHNALGKVRYGIEGHTFDIIGELLEVTSYKQ